MKDHKKIPWRPFVDKVAGFKVAQAAYGGEMARETFKCFAEWSGRFKEGGTVGYRVSGI